MDLIEQYNIQLCSLFVLTKHHECKVQSATVPVAVLIYKLNNKYVQEVSKVVIILSQYLIITNINIDVIYIIYYIIYNITIH